MEEDNKLTENIAADRSDTPFSKEEDMIALLSAIFSRGYMDLPPDILPGRSVEEKQSALKSAYEQVTRAIKGKPTIIDWLQSELFLDEESNVPLALLFIDSYERHPPPCEKNGEGDLREIYHFIYKMMINQPAAQLSDSSAKVLHALLSEIIEEVWPDTQKEVLHYISETYGYSRPGQRRTYSRKRSFPSQFH